MQIKRFCSQFTFCSPDKILRQAVIEQNSNQIITDIFCLSDRHTESAHTLFVDGIISSEIVSLKQNLPPEDLIFIKNNYQYIDFSNDASPDTIRNNSNKLIFDFGTESLEETNNLILSSLPYLSSLSVFDIIAASVYYPVIAIGKDAELAPGTETELILWRGINLINKRTTDRTRITSLNSI